MTLAEALELVEAGERVTSEALPRGTVLKREKARWYLDREIANRKALSNG